jgi:serine/threonine-protein kinase RsbW
MSAETHIELANDLAEVSRLAAAVEAFGAEHALSEGTIFALNLALEELVTNVIMHGGVEPGRRVVEVRLAVDGSTLRAVVSDDAREFNPLDCEEPNLGSDIEARRVGGLGVHLIKNLMDDIAYRRENGKNVLSMRKTMTEGTSLR